MSRLKKQNQSKAKNKGKEEKTLTAKDHHKNEKEPTRIGSFIILYSLLTFNFEYQAQDKLEAEHYYFKQLNHHNNEKYYHTDGVNMI